MIIFVLHQVRQAFEVQNSWFLFLGFEFLQKQGETGNEREHTWAEKEEKDKKKPLRKELNEEVKDRVAKIKAGSLESMKDGTKQRELDSNAAKEREKIRWKN